MTVPGELSSEHTSLRRSGAHSAYEWCLRRSNRRASEDLGVKQEGTPPSREFRHCRIGFVGSIDQFVTRRVRLPGPRDSVRHVRLNE